MATTWLESNFLGWPMLLTPVTDADALYLPGALRSHWKDMVGPDVCPKGENLKWFNPMWKLQFVCIWYWPYMVLNGTDHIQTYHVFICELRPQLIFWDKLEILGIAWYHHGCFHFTWNKGINKLQQTLKKKMSENTLNLSNILCQFMYTIFYLTKSLILHCETWHAWMKSILYVCAFVCLFVWVCVKGREGDYNEMRKRFLACFILHVSWCERTCMSVRIWRVVRSLCVLLFFCSSSVHSRWQ